MMFDEIIEIKNLVTAQSRENDEKRDSNNDGFSLRNPFDGMKIPLDTEKSLVELETKLQGDKSFFYSVVYAIKNN